MSETLLPPEQRLPALPWVTIPVWLADRLWSITCVQSRRELAGDTVRSERDLYGFLLWEAAIGLAEELVQRRAQIAGTQVLELGAGVGLPGLVAQSLGARMHQTDYQPDALALAQWNAQQNDIVGIETLLADWRTWHHRERYDFILGADILYEEALHFYLEAIFHRNLAPGGALLLADPGRPQALDFAVQLEAHGWHIELTTRSVPAVQGGAENVEVSILTARLARFTTLASSKKGAQLE
ncbi:MAG: methyltransferase domain-containing protein [Caldilineaceae bacterium]